MGSDPSLSALPPPWSTCEAVLSETFRLPGGQGAHSLGTLLRRRSPFVAFEVGENLEPVLRLIEKYRDVPISLADACLVPIVKPSLTPSSGRLTRISVA